MDPRLERWLDALLAEPGLTSIRDRDRAWAQHVVDSLAALELVGRFEGDLVDVGSGGGAPGIPLAAALPERSVTLLEANGRKAAFLERIAADFANVSVVRGRAEEQAVETFGVAVAKALAPPVVALEWCLPLVRTGGASILYTVGDVDSEALSRAAAQLGGGTPSVHVVTAERRLAVVPKVGPTPAGFPRRPGVARKRPL